MSDAGGAGESRSFSGCARCCRRPILGAAFAGVDRLVAFIGRRCSSSTPARRHRRANRGRGRRTGQGHRRRCSGFAQPTANYLLVSCKNRDDPPYQGAVYLDFTLPADVGADAVFPRRRGGLVARGWAKGPPPNQHLFGRNMSKDGVSALMYPGSDSVDARRRTDPWSVPRHDRPPQRLGSMGRRHRPAALSVREKNCARRVTVERSLRWGQPPG